MYTMKIVSCELFEVTAYGLLYPVHQGYMIYGALIQRFNRTCFIFRRIKQEQSQARTNTENSPKLDLGFKEGQTITINFGVSLF